METEPTRVARMSWLLPIECAAFVAVYWADQRGLVPLSKTPFLLAIAWLSLRVRGCTWRGSGLRLGARPLRRLAVGVAAGIAFWAFEYFAENPVLHALLGVHPDLREFADVVGNAQLLAIYLALNLVLAGFGEEMVWRGYALPRVAAVAGGGTAAWALALVGVNVAFGFAHVYQGESGVVQAAVQGALLGALYLATGRNLVAPIAAHVVANTCDFVLIYLGVHVGLRASG